MDKKSFIVCIIGLGLFIVLIIWRNVNQNDLKKNGVLVEAQILTVKSGSKAKKTKGQYFIFPCHV